MIRSALLSLHERSGARLTGPAEAPVLLTYGDVPAEYRAGTTGCAVFDETTRGALVVRGDDAETFLHRITANRVRGLAPGEGNRNLLLSPKGKVQHEFVLRRREGDFHLSTTAGRAADLASALDTYLFADAVELEDATESHAPLELCGPAAADALCSVLGDEPPDAPHRTRELAFEGRPAWVTPLPVAGSAGWRVDVGPEAVDALWLALVESGCVPAGVAVHDILRVEAGRAAWGSDVTGDVYPQEARLDEAFSLDKGCYIGQEVVAKIDTYGGLNKCLFGLRIDHDDPVRPGTRLLREDGGETRDLGIVTSWAYSFVLDTGMALGYVKRKHQARGTVFRLQDSPGTATVVALPVRDSALPVSGEQP